MIIHFQQEISEHGHTQPLGCELMWPVPQNEGRDSSRRMEPLIMDSHNYTLENQSGTQSWRFGIWFSFSKG